MLDGALLSFLMSAQVVKIPCILEKSMKLKKELCKLNVPDIFKSHSENV